MVPLTETERQLVELIRKENQFDGQSIDDLLAELANPAWSSDWTWPAFVYGDVQSLWPYLSRDAQLLMCLRSLRRMESVSAGFNPES